MLGDMLHAGCSLYREHLHHTDPLCTLSALLGGILYSAPALCIMYDSFLASPTYCILGEFLHSAPASCIGTLSALSWLWVSFCIPHSASCILHVSHSCSFGPASAFCILHLHPASGAVHSFGADSAFCILHLHPASGAVHSFGADSAFYILHLLLCLNSASASCMRAQITHDHLLRSANGATRPGFRTQQPPAGPREQRVSSGELS